MSHPNTSEKHQAVWTVVQRLNRAAAAGDVAALEPLVHPDIVVVPPGFQVRAVGRAAYLKSVEDFAARGTVQSYEALEPEIDLYDTTAVVAYRYESVWEAEGERHTERGHELWVLVQQEEGWVLAWRTLI